MQESTKEAVASMFTASRRPRRARVAKAQKLNLWRKLIFFSSHIHVLSFLPVIYFSPFVSPKTAILLLERLNIPFTEISEPICYNIIIYRTAPSLSILSRQEYIAATWWESLFKFICQNIFLPGLQRVYSKDEGRAPVQAETPQILSLGSQL